MASAAAAALREVRESVSRPYPVAPQIFLLLAIVPVYIFIPGLLDGRALHSPESGLDRLIPLVPAWSLIYGALYAFLIVVPAFVVRGRRDVRRMFSAYLGVWLTAYLIFMLYPTTAPRPHAVIGEGFAVWGLRHLYGADPPYNCFPSIHVAHSFVSAFACYAVHRRVGIFTLGCATLVAISTLFTKQHYVVDLVAGIFLAGLSFAIFAGRYPHDTVPDDEKRLAPALALCVFAAAVLGILIAWVVYRVGTSL